MERQLSVTPRSAHLGPGGRALPGLVGESTRRQRRQRRLPIFLRVRGRATVVVVVVGLPLLAAWVYARVAPTLLWFDEVGQQAVLTRTIEARVDFHLRVLVVVAAFVWANLLIACRGSALTRARGGAWALLGCSLVVGSLFATAVGGRLETYLLWRHRQPFGTVDPTHGKDVGFYVFTLPFLLLLAGWLLALVVVTAAVVLLTYWLRGAVSVRLRWVGFAAHAHLATLVAAFLLALAWRLHLGQYELELGQPAPNDPHSFAGASYLDVQVTSQVLSGLVVAAVVLAGAALLSPLVSRTRHARAARRLLCVLVAGTLVGGTLVAALAPIVVQRYVVDPNRLVVEKPYLERTIAATRAAWGLDRVEVVDYDPEGDFDAADFAESRQRFARLPTWDGYVIGARMRELASERPYFEPGDPVPDVVTLPGGRPHLTLVSARDLDLSRVPEGGDGWANDRLAYTHGLGLLRFSSKLVDAGREPRILDRGLGVRQPRIYFGDLAEPDGRAEDAWVVANTRRPEVDVPESGVRPRAGYHYDGEGGIALSSTVRRAVFALALGSKELLLSEEITPDSRVLLHRDVHDRLRTLAPFVHWDAEAVPLTVDGRIQYVVDGYTTSDSYPYAEQVALGDEQVSYARASVIATVDSFDGDVVIYVVDEDEPVLRAWREVFPTLFTPFAQFPDELRSRLRYPAELYAAQAAAYERFHVTDPDVFVSEAEAWARPLALSGPIEVAGDVDFDESDEDDLRLTMPPVQIWVPPPGEEDPRLVLTTYFSPERGQNLVGSLNGWVDDSGRARLVNRVLPRSPVTLGPAQVSRLVFATPRVGDLLGLRNLEIRDLDKSSIDSVLLGRPRIMFLPGGIVQVQSLYEGSRGPGAARLLGVTAFVNGRAGLSPTVAAAVRQALNRPPEVRVVVPDAPVVAGARTQVAFDVENARSQAVTITLGSHEERTRASVRSGRGTVSWVPPEAGTATVRVAVRGLDGTRTSQVARFDVVGPAPRLRLLDRPTGGTVGEPVVVRFAVAHGVGQVAEISTREGIVFERRFDLRDGQGVVEWVPETPGRAELVIRARGTEGQSTSRRWELEVAPSTAVTVPAIEMVRAPRRGVVGEETRFEFRADGCLRAEVSVADSTGAVGQEWTLPCPAHPAEVVWRPTTPGVHVLTFLARGEGTTSTTSVSVRVREEP